MHRPSFAHRLHQAIARTGNILCVGIDPHPQIMPAAFGGPDQIYGDKDSLDNLYEFSLAVINAAAGSVPAIKPQAALFEAHGPGGLEILRNIARAGQQAGLLVIMDAKRGDIGSTAKAYAQGWMGADAAFPSDALTVNPYLGIDSLEPFFDTGKDTATGLFILVRTSNSGSRDLQQQLIGKIPLYHHLAHCLAPHIQKACEADINLSSIGIVAGATGPAEAQKLREILPSAPFLIPGYGAQGASAKQATAGLVRNPQGHLTGGLVNASRAITHNPQVQQAKSPASATKAMQQAISQALQDLDPLTQ